MNCKNCKTEFEGKKCPNCGWRNITLFLDASALISQKGIIPMLTKRGFTVRVPFGVFQCINGIKDRRNDSNQAVAEKCYYQLTHGYADTIVRCTDDDIASLPLEMKFVQGNNNIRHPISLTLAPVRKSLRDKKDVYFVTDDIINRKYCDVISIPVLSSQEVCSLSCMPATTTPTPPQVPVPTPDKPESTLEAVAPAAEAKNLPSTSDVTPVESNPTVQKAAPQLQQIPPVPQLPNEIDVKLDFDFPDLPAPEL